MQNKDILNGLELNGFEVFCIDTIIIKKEKTFLLELSKQTTNGYAYIRSTLADVETLCRIGYSDNRPYKCFNSGVILRPLKG